MIKESRNRVQLRDELYTKEQDEKGHITEQKVPLSIRGKNLNRIPHHKNAALCKCASRPLALLPSFILCGGMEPACSLAGVVT